MNDSKPAVPLGYKVEISPVREVALHGRADHGFWADRLAGAGLHPTRVDGAADLLISAIDARFMGLRFQEMVLAVSVCREKGGSRRDGAYLVQAFNSRRFFAFVERVMFSTPYHHAEVQVQTGALPAVELKKGGASLLRAARSGTGAAGGGAPRPAGHDWEGPIFLPAAGKLFFARIRGETKLYPFDPARDVVAIRPVPGTPVLGWLLESGFAGKEWAVRESAIHGKSKTVSRQSVKDYLSAAFAMSEA